MQPTKYFSLSTKLNSFNKAEIIKELLTYDC